MQEFAKYLMVAGLLLVAAGAVLRWRIPSTLWLYVVGLAVLVFLAGSVLAAI